MSQLDDELAGMRWQYLNDPKFHALVTTVVRERYREQMDALAAAERTVREQREVIVKAKDVFGIDRQRAPGHHHGVCDSFRCSGP